MKYNCKSSVYGFALSFLLLLGCNTVKGQGCSDAGFCTVHSLKPTNQNDSGKVFKNAITLGFSHGLGDFKIKVSTPYVEYSRFFSDRWSINLKLVYLMANGELAKTNGFSDVYVNVNHSFSQRFKATLGLKVPLNDGNLQSDGKSLPMNYQTSLGTFDLIAGLSYYPLTNLGLTFAVQQPLNQNNNQFEREGTHLFIPTKRDLYPPTRGYHRKGDILFRLNYRLELIKNKLELTPSVLPIYHLGEDTYLDNEGNRNSIEGSQGLTLNGTLFLLYHLNKRNAIELNFGTPFIARKARPDGLTRKYVLGLEYKVRF